MVSSYMHQMALLTMTLIWGPTVAALSFVFDKSNDATIYQKAISGFKEKIEESLLLGEVMITVFWYCEGVVVVNVLLRWETFNCIAYIRTLTELRKHFKLIQPDQNPTEILLHHDNARLHTSLKILEAITEYGVAVLCHLPYSLNVAPSDFCLFGALNDEICSMKFEIGDVIHVMRTCLCEQDKA